MKEPLRGILLQSMEAHRDTKGELNEAFVADVEKAILACVIAENEACAKICEDAGRAVDPSPEAMALGMVCERIRARRRGRPPKNSA